MLRLRCHLILSRVRRRGSQRLSMRLVSRIHHPRIWSSCALVRETPSPGFATKHSDSCPLPESLGTCLQSPVVRLGTSPPSPDRGRTGPISKERDDNFRTEGSGKFCESRRHCNRLHRCGRCCFPRPGLAGNPISGNSGRQNGIREMGGGHSARFGDFPERTHRYPSKCVDLPRQTRRCRCRGDSWSSRS